MKCKKCGSENVTYQVINEQKLVNKHHGIIWWCLIGIWWVPCKWLFLTVPALIFKIFVGNRKKIKNIQKKVAVCQNCGHHWNI